MPLSKFPAFYLKRQLTFCPARSNKDGKLIRDNTSVFLVFREMPFTEQKTLKIQKFWCFIYPQGLSTNMQQQVFNELLMGCSMYPFQANKSSPKRRVGLETSHF